MAHWRGRTALQMRDAADVGRHDDFGFHLAQVAELAVSQLVSNFWLQHGIGAGRAAAQVRLAACGLDVKAQRTQMLFNTAAQLLAVLKCAGWVKGDLPRRCRNLVA